MISLFQVASDLQHFFLQRNWRFCFIGGIALQRWGQPRLTLDVDVTLLTGIGTEKTYIDILCEQYELRIPDARAFALQNRVLLLKGAHDVPMDIALAALPYEELVIQRATDYLFAPAAELHTCSAEDLIVLKAFADRSRDWPDIEGILQRQGHKLDRDYILQQLAPLCEMKESPEIVQKLQQLYNRFD